jgi:hypothetical protein
MTQPTPHIVVAGPIPGIPRAPGSVDSTCDKCLGEVYLAPSTAALLRRDRRLVKLCFTCALPLLTGAEVGGVKDYRGDAPPG